MKNPVLKYTLVIVILILSTSGCNEKKESIKSIIGKWTHPIILEPNYTGFEILEIDNGTQGVLKFDFHYEGEEEGFKYLLDFTSGVPASLSLDSKNLLLYFDISKFFFKTKPGSFKIFLTNNGDQEYKGTAKKDMERVLVDSLQNVFKNSFRAYEKIPYKFSEVSLVNDSLVCNFEDQQIWFSRIN